MVKAFLVLIVTVALTFVALAVVFSTIVIRSENEEEIFVIREKESTGVPGVTTVTPIDDKTRSTNEATPPLPRINETVMEQLSKSSSVAFIDNNVQNESVNDPDIPVAKFEPKKIKFVSAPSAAAATTTTNSVIPAILLVSKEEVNAAADPVRTVGTGVMNGSKKLSAENSLVVPVPVFIVSRLLNDTKTMTRSPDYHEEFN